MFGQSNPFGQSTNSPFGSQSVFGQTNNNPSSNPFAPKPFGSTTPFGAQTGGSLFGGTSTGVFGAQSSSPLPSTPTFGASSSPAFGSSMPAFGASSTPAFGTSVFGQKPAFGGFGSSTTTQTSPFGGGSFQQQSQPAFGSSLFGSSTTPFGAPSQPAFGTPTTPAFGATTTPAFGSTPSPAFGTTGNAFGTTGNAFGTTTPAFGASTPAFGSSTTPTFGTSTTPPPFGASSSSPFGGGSSAPSFSFGGSSPAFGQSASAFGSTPFAATSSPPFGAQSSQFGAQATTPTFGTTTGFGGQSNFGGQQRGGSRVTPYTPTPETESGSGAQAGKLESISAMQVYKDKSHEELRWEDYQLGDKGGPNPAGQSTGGIGFGVTNTQQPNPFGGSQGFTQPVANPFSSATSSNPFAPKPQALTSTGFGSTTSTFGSSSPFGTSTTSNPFGSSTQSTTTSLFGTTTGFGSSTSPSLFGTTSGFGSSTSIFGSTSAQGTTNAFNSGLNFGNTQSSPLFQSTTSSLGQTTSPFGQQTASAFGQTGSAFGQTGSAFGQSNLFSSPSTGFGGNLFSTTSSLTTNNTGFNQANPTLTTPFQSAQPSQTTSAFGFNNFGQTQAVGQGGFGGGTPNMFGQSNFGPVTTTQSIAVAQPTSVTNPFGTLPAMPQMSIGRAGTSPSIQYGISSLPVVDKPAPVRISSLLTSRHLSQRRIRLPARKYHPKSDGPKIPFFSDDEETQSTPKADALFVPRENPRALVIRPLDQWTGRVASVKMSPSKEKPATDQENGKVSEGVFVYTNGFATEDRNEVAIENGNSKAVKVTQKSNGTHQEEQKGDSYITLTGHRAGEAAIVYEHGADIEALMPKLRHSDYYTEPRIQELAAKERAEPGFCRHVKEFVVGRHGYGSIKFLGETDVRRLELESLIQFNHREVIVYMDESKKPPVGQGLNKHAEVTLLNIKCFDKKTGQHFTQGPRIEKYKEMLKKKAEDQGAEFVSYDPIKGEWKFRVNHFSAYSLQDEDEEDHLSSG